MNLCFIPRHKHALDTALLNYSNVSSSAEYEFTELKSRMTESEREVKNLKQTIQVLL